MSIPSEYKKLLENQQYEFIGEHSAVKICTWTKKSIRNEGVCYKQKFYGIESHRCCQLSLTVNYCDQDCVYCWRNKLAIPFDTLDNPKQLAENCITAQRKLLTGFGGNEKANKKKLEEAQNPTQFAISLTGETLYYPKLSEFIKILKDQGHSTFVVSNGQLPDVLEKLELPTQIYISLDAPNETLHKQICNPTNEDSWQRLNRSLEILNKVKDKTRTALRLTIINGMNDIEPESYVKLFEKANPHFIEVKAYMFVGASQNRLSIDKMPRHPEVKAFAEKLCEISDYKIIDEQEESRVLLLMKDSSEMRKIKWQ
jgi:tRNA wybutosine-synthesizing protein 1